MTDRAPAAPPISPDVDRIRRDIEVLARYTVTGEPYTRLSFSEQDLQARRYVRELMRSEAGLEVHIDAAGNIIGRTPADGGPAPIVMGSHIDTVKGGGRFDGIAGVVAAIEVARRFAETRRILPRPLEIIVFTAEEPSPFGLSCIGSRAMTGTLNPALLDRVTDSSGRRLSEAIDQIGGNAAAIRTVERKPGSIHSFIELHIEQGPILAPLSPVVGLVTDITAIYRGQVRIDGRPDHAGTTPMNARRDALAAAAEVILSLESICRAADRPGNPLVGTIGRIAALPDASNVIPGSVTLELEMRSPEVAAIKRALDRFRESVSAKSSARGVAAQLDAYLSSAPTHFDPAVLSRLEAACGRLDIPYRRMSSMAGHDATHMAEIAPAAMIFIPSKDGRSHCPEEWSDCEHISLGAQVMAAYLEDSAQEK